MSAIGILILVGSAMIVSATGLRAIYRTNRRRHDAFDALCLRFGLHPGATARQKGQELPTCRGVVCGYGLSVSSVMARGARRVPLVVVELARKQPVPFRFSISNDPPGAPAGATMETMSLADSSSGLVVTVSDAVQAQQLLSEEVRRKLDCVAELGLGGEISSLGKSVAYYMAADLDGSLAIRRCEAAVELMVALAMAMDQAHFFYRETPQLSFHPLEQDNARCQQK